MIAGNVARALDDIAASERDLRNAYAPGAIPEHGDVARASHSTYTVDPLSVAAPESAYFALRDRSGHMLFTRDGSFQVRDGRLMDAHGDDVLGYAGDGAALAPIRIDPIDAAFGAAGDARIETDGSLSGVRWTVDPRTGQRRSQLLQFGRIALARFPAGTRLQPAGAQHLSAPAGIPPHFGKPGDGNFGALKTHARETSGVDIDASIERLQEAYVALDAIRAAAKSHGTLQKVAMDLLK
ncbi:MAG: hypothetical protein JOZ01_03510 [Candidatus Eremiobacteraeota bacterium]|nr:hypothetical protein [Candidatus Eremiobacteraeota bacterium]